MDFILPPNHRESLARSAPMEGAPSSYDGTQSVLGRAPCLLPGVVAMGTPMALRYGRADQLGTPDAVISPIVARDSLGLESVAISGVSTAVG